MTDRTDRALALLASLRLEDEQPWGVRATPHQWADARAVLDETGPRRHWLGRSRGYSKTTDVAGMAIAMLLTQLQPGTRMYCAAADRDQAGLLLNALRSFVQRTPELRAQLNVQTGRVIAERTGSVLEVLAADAASAYGLLPGALVVDEICQWPSTSNAKEFFAALTSALPKVPGSRLVVMSTAGDPAHWSRKLYEQALKSEMWRVSEVRNPAPWHDPAELAEQEASLLPSVFARLFRNEWTASEDRLVDPADLDAAMCLPGDLDYVSSNRYVIGVDVGLKNDATVVVVAHREPYYDGERASSRIVVDRLRRWRGSRDNPVELDVIENAISGLSARFGRASAVIDPWQAMGLLQRLQAQGVNAREFVFGSQSTGRLAMGLYSLLKGRRLWLPNDELLREELLAVRLRETVPGQYRLDHDSGRHDDQAVAIALAAHDLLTEDQGVSAAQALGWLRESRGESRAGTPPMLAAIRNIQRGGSWPVPL